MVNFVELMGILSRPRPNGSAALRETAQAIKDWLSHRDIPCRTQTFDYYPYFFESIGIWIILSRTLLALSIWLRWGWPALLIAGIGLLGGLLDVGLNFPFASRPVKRQGENILIEFEPEDARQELILSAHYDSKTELLDHRRRMFFLKNLRLGIVLTVLLGILGPVDRYLLSQGSDWSGITYTTGTLLSLVLLFLAWGLGLNLTTGRLLKPSLGAVDNGTACAILLALADLLNREMRLARTAPDFKIPLRQTRVTLALFTGEEVNMQGSRAYALGREWPLPAAALNLEVMAQDGEYVIWEKDGDVFRRVSCSTGLNELAASAVEKVTGAPPRPAGPVISDGGSFLAAGIPATTLGTYDIRLVDTGFHGPADNLDRVVFDRLPEGVEILMKLIEEYDSLRRV